jgi:hypothetical protein
VDLEPPGVDEVTMVARAVVTAAGGPDGLTEVQHLVLAAHFDAMTGFHLDLDRLEPLGPQAFAEAMRRRDGGFRARMVQIMLLEAFIVTPLLVETVDRIAAYARELSIDDDMVRVAHRMAEGALGLVAVDFNRAGYASEWDGQRDLAPLHVTTGLPDGWAAVEHDPELAARWSALGDRPAGSLGRLVWEFYQARGFVFPGLTGSAPPLLAQHDWVHVVADYGSTVESEIEVFGLISRANDDPKGFSLLAMVLGLFETGMLRSGAGLFEYDPHHLSGDASRMAVRLADATYRGAIVGARFGGRDLLAVDWFALADEPVEGVRELLGIPPKSEAAVAAGSVGPWAPGGISPFQLAAGRSRAEAEGREYESYGARAAALEGQPG